MYPLTRDQVGIINRGKYRGQLQIGTNERDCYEERKNKIVEREKEREREREREKVDGK